MGQAGRANASPQSSQLKNPSEPCSWPSIGRPHGPERPDFGHLRPFQRRSEGHFRFASDFFNSLYFYEIEKPVAQGSFTSPSSDLLDADRVLANYSKTGARVSLYSSPELDKLFETERAELDNAKREVTLKQMGRH